MKVTYDPEVDVLRIILRDTVIKESDEHQLGIVFDYDEKGEVVGIEILGASTRVENPRGVEYAITA